MKTIYLKTVCFDRWKVKFSSIPQQGSIVYTFSIFDSASTENQYNYQQICSTEAEAYLAAYFYCLRASLDRENRPALIVDLESDYILSINLAAFELLAIDAVGVKTLDFIVNPEQHRQLYRELQQTQESYQSILLRNADGCWIECEVTSQITPDYCKWAIFYLNSNQSQLYSPLPTGH